MQCIYRLQYDPLYQTLAIADASLLAASALKFDSTSRSSTWKPIEFVCVDVQKQVPDFWRVEGVPNAFVCNERVLNNVPSLWEEGFCEPLLVHYCGADLWLCNVTEYGCWDALDVEKCIWPSEIPKLGLPLRYAFILSRLIFTTVLTVPETCEQELYIYEYNGNPTYEFKASVERQKMTGLVFEKIWDENDTLNQV